MLEFLKLRVKLSLLIALLFFTGLSAQERIVLKGVVLDNMKMPIPGVNVTVAGQGQGTITELDGTFKMNVSTEDEICFSYIGYKTMYVKIEGRSTMAITMEEESVYLNEIVAIGYGSQTKKEVTGSIATVKSEDFVKGVVANPMGLVQGKVAGLNVIKVGGGDPANNNYEVQLRGVGSLKGNTQPLYIIDGIPGGDLSSVNPNDIESIDVLKDGSAAAIYGTRANHGVILITTKRGSTDGKSSIEYNGSASTSVISKKLRMLSASEYSGLRGSNLGADTDWLDEITRTPISTSHSLAMSGGTRNFSYRASIGYKQQQGLALKSDYEEINGRFAANQKAINNRFELAYDFSYSSAKKNWADYNNFNQALNANPTQPVYRDPETTSEEELNKYNGFYETDAYSGQYWNPVADIANTDSEEQYKVLIASVKAIVNFTDNLKFTTFYTLQEQNQYNGKYINRYSRREANKNGVASVSQANNRSETVENTLQYSIEKSRNSFSAIIGQSYQYNEYSSFGAYNSDFPIDDFKWNNLGSGSNLQTGDTDLAGMNSEKYSDKLASFFARAVYNYNQKYFLNASVRMEGSSKFGPKADPKLGRWGIFPAVSGSWRISEEEAVTDWGVFNDLKLRAGYGVTGNMPNESYLYLMKVGQTGEPLYSNGQFVKPWGATSNVNEYIKWEKKHEYNVGIDFAILSGRLSGTFDAYLRETEDLLWEYDVPVPPYPMGKKWDNYGQLRNHGFELALNYELLRNRNYTFNVGVVAARNRNKVIRITGGEYAENNPGYLNVGFISTGDGETGSYVMRLQQGEPIGNFYGWKYVGINSDGKWVFETPEGGYTTSPTEAQKQILGNALPDVTFGVSLSCSYKRFDASVNFRGQLGGLIFNETRYFYENQIAGGNILHSALEGDAARLNDIRRFSDFYLEDATFLKCSDITLGYNVNLNNKYIKTSRVFVNCQNVFTLTNYTGVDPEVSMNGLTPGFDSRNYYPAERSFLFGASLTF